MLNQHAYVGRSRCRSSDVHVPLLFDFTSYFYCLRRSESVSLNESDDRVRELSKENVTLKEQVFLAQEKVRELQVELSAKNSEIASAKRGIEELSRNSVRDAYRGY
ncbi:hypothetical protein COOONC_15742 [Cooperia oncophora]